MHTHELSTKPSLAGRWLVLVSIIILLGYTWSVLLTTEFKPLWQHWLGLAAIVAVIFVNIRHARLGIVLTTIYLLLGIFCLFSFLPSLTRSFIRIGPLSIPLGQPIAWPFSILHVAINFNSLVDYYLDWKTHQIKN